MKEAATTNIEGKLIASFKELAMKEPVEKITIREIADGAGVIRTTFYYHFRDKYELIERIIQQDLIAPLLELLGQDRIDDMFYEILKRLDAERAFYRRLARMEGQNSFGELLQQNISAVLQELISAPGFNQSQIIRTGKYRWLTPKFTADYYAQSITFTLITFLNTDPPATPEEGAEVFDYVVCHTLNETIVEWYRK